jgi:hypothetical protein
MPSGFDRYVRIFPAFVSNGGDEDDGSGPRRKWADLAAEAGVTFHAELSDDSLEAAIRDTESGEYLWGCGEGELDPIDERELLDVLTRGGNREICAYFAPEGLFDIETVVWRGEAEQFADLKKHLRLCGPEYMWSPDRSWIVHTNCDGPLTYLACSNEMADAVLANANLETLEVGLDVRYDAWMDTVNGTVDANWPTLGEVWLNAGPEHQP